MSSRSGCVVMLKLASLLARPTLHDNLGFRIKLHSVLALRVDDAEEAFLPAIKRKVGHWRCDPNIDSNVASRCFISELPRRTSTRREQRRLIAVGTFSNKVDRFLDGISMNQA